jgi:hypothetical protein
MRWSRVHAQRLVEPVHAHHDTLAALDRLLDPEGRLVDLILIEALLDRRHGATHPVDPLDVGDRQALELLGQRLDVVRAAERIGHPRDPGLVPDHLLGAQRDLG